MSLLCSVFFCRMTTNSTCFNSFSPSALLSTSAITCTARSSRKPRRRLSTNSKKRRAAGAASRDRELVPINADNIDTTDITTYVSCPTCFNSLMIRPEQLERGPLDVRCNCCGKSNTARMSDMENVDGTEFDYLTWKKEYLKSKIPLDTEENLPPYSPPTFYGPM